MEYHELEQIDSEEIAWMANIQDDEYVHKLLTTRFDQRSRDHVVISQQIYVIVIAGMIGDERHDLSTVNWKHTLFRLPFDIMITYVKINKDVDEYLSFTLKQTCQSDESDVYTKVYVRGTTLNNFFRHFHRSINPDRVHGYPFERFAVDTERTVMVREDGMDSHNFKVISYI